MQNMQLQCVSIERVEVSLKEEPRINFHLPVKSAKVQDVY